MQLDEQGGEIDDLDGRVTIIEADCVDKQSAIDDLELAVDGLLDMKAMLA